MEDFFLFLNQPIVLWSLITASVLLILVDYLFPVDWPAYLGYIAFSLFLGATVPLSPFSSLIFMAGVFILILALHEFLFAKFLTNAPRYERVTDGEDSVGKKDSGSEKLNEGGSNDV